MKQLSIPGTRRFQPNARLPGDELMRQQMRLARKAMRSKDMQIPEAMADQLRAKRQEHVLAIQKKEEMAKELVTQFQQTQAAFQEQMNNFKIDVERRQGAITQIDETLNMGQEPATPAGDGAAQPG
jgi:ribosomal 50S subunit-associated protein YjgA (DUF615 family)